MSDTLTIYICADATLTYGPIGGTRKIIPQALPLCQVRDVAEAEFLITTVGSAAYGEHEMHENVEPGYGPKQRYHYTLRDFRRGDPDTIFDAADTMEALRDAHRSGDNQAFRAAFEAANSKDLGLEIKPTYRDEEAV